MAEGHFIRLGDKTTCGGKVKDADTRVMMYGLAHAREGDPVTCGVDGETYRIEGGISYMVSHGRLVAGTLDSFSGCPCKATLIASDFTGSYESSRSAAPHAARAVRQPSALASNPVASHHHHHHSRPRGAIRNRYRSIHRPRSLVFTSFPKAPPANNLKPIYSPCATQR